VNIENLVKRLRKRLERVSYFHKRLVIGGLDISLNLTNNILQGWQLHLYLLIEGKKTRKLKAAVKQAFPPEPTAKRPYRFRPVKQRAEAISYAHKAVFNRRSSYLKNGKPRTRNLPLKDAELCELCTFLDRFPLGSRLILRGVRRNGKRLQRIAKSTAAQPKPTAPKQ
jgi:hypothetical protein